MAISNKATAKKTTKTAAAAPKPPRLYSIEREAEMCRKAFEKVEVRAIVWHCHHAEGLEILTEPAENRISFILTEKVEGERALRLRRFRPLSPLALRKLPAKLTKADADRQKADADWQKAYADWQKADADWQKADADWQKADADWQKADADRQKADADWQKADGFHKETCGCLWSQTTDIFGDPR